MRSTPHATPSLPSAAPALGEHLPTKALPAPSPPAPAAQPGKLSQGSPFPPVPWGGSINIWGYSQMESSRERQDSRLLLVVGRKGGKLLWARRVCSWLSHNAAHPCFQ